MTREPAITPERIAKGDLHVKYNTNKTIQYAQVKEISVIDYLVDMEILSHQDKWYGHTYEIWEAVFLAPVALHKNRLKEYIPELRSMLHTEGLKEEQFRDLLRMLPARVKYVIDHAMRTAATHTERINAYRSRGTYQMAFEALGKTMDVIKKKNETDSAC